MSGIKKLIPKVVIAAILVLLILKNIETVNTVVVFLFYFILPGFIIIPSIFKKLDLLNKTILSFATSVALFYLISLGIYLTNDYFINAKMLFLSETISIIILLIISSKIKPSDLKIKPFKKFDYAFIILLLAFLIFTRFTYLGYSEYQGDESDNVLKFTRRMNHPETTINLFDQRRGPIQVIIPLAKYLHTKNFNEFGTRFPFAFANIAAILSIYYFAREAFSRKTAAAATLFMALNGFFTAFGRIIQYQSFAILFIILSIYFLYLNYKKSDFKFLVFGTIFYALALLSHYDAIFALPVILLLLFYVRKKVSLRQTIILAIVFIGLTALFFLPFFLNPEFKEMMSHYLGSRVVGGAGFKIYPALELSFVYNSFYYLVTIFALGIIGLISSIYYFKKINNQIALLLFLIPFVFFIYFMKAPKTHIYFAFLGLSLLAAVGFNYIWRIVSKQKNAKNLFAVVIIFLLILGGNHIYILFIKHDPEYVWTAIAQKDAKLKYYPTPFKEIPRVSLFGFPYHRGWKEVNELQKEGIFGRSYQTNDRFEIADFYMPMPPRKTKQLKEDHFVYVYNTQNRRAPKEFNLKKIQKKYNLAAQIYYKDRLDIEIYTDNEVKEIKIVNSAK